MNDRFETFDPLLRLPEDLGAQQRGLVVRAGLPRGSFEQQRLVTTPEHPAGAAAAAQIPPPWFHVVSYYGLPAPAAAARDRIVPGYAEACWGSEAGEG